MKFPEWPIHPIKTYYVNKLSYSFPILLFFADKTLSMPTVLVLKGKSHWWLFSIFKFNLKFPEWPIHPIRTYYVDKSSYSWPILLFFADKTLCMPKVLVLTGKSHWRLFSIFKFNLKFLEWPLPPSRTYCVNNSSYSWLILQIFFVE